MNATEAKGRTPRWKQIYRTLRQEVPNYVYGSNFYTIAQICEKFDVSTITATRVLREMEDEGLVEKIRRRGTVVRRVDKAVAVWMLASSQRPLDFPDFDSHWMRLITAADRFAQQHGARFDVIGETHVDSLLQSQTDPFGILLTSSLTAETLSLVRGSGRTHVYLDAWLVPKRGPWAKLDRKAVSALAVEHLLELGHRRIACIFGSFSERGWRQRLIGYRRALEAGGVKFRWRYVTDVNLLEPGPAPESGAEALRRGQQHLKAQLSTAFDKLMACSRKPTAIIAGDDMRAALLLDLCRDRGIHVPGELSIVGFPNNPESRLTTPPLTVVDGCYEQVAEAAMQLLLDQMFQGAAPNAQRAVIQPKLVVRATTGAPPKPCKSKDADTRTKQADLESR